MSTKNVALTIVLVGFGLWAVPAGDAQDVGDANTPTEKSSVARELKFLDRDRDGRVDSKELEAGQIAAAALLALTVEDADSNNDGTISAAELEEAVKKAVAQLKEAQEDAAAVAETEGQDALDGAAAAQVILDRLATNEAYRAEIAALRAAVSDLSNDDAVVTYVIDHSTQYPRLAPLFRTWVRYYPAPPVLHRHIRPAPHWRPHVPGHVKPKPAVHHAPPAHAAPKSGAPKAGHAAPHGGPASGPRSGGGRRGR